MVVRDCFSAGRELCDGCAAVATSIGEDVARDPCQRYSAKVRQARKTYPCAHTKKRKAAKAAAVIPVAAPVAAPAPLAMEVDSGVSLRGADPADALAAAAADATV